MLKPGILDALSAAISSWDEKSQDLLADDLTNGELLKQYIQKAQALRPTSPPGGCLYAERPDRKETAPAFVKRVYGEAGWLNGHFTLADLRKLDPKAAAGLHNYESNNRVKLTLGDLNLPTLKQHNDAAYARGDFLDAHRAGHRVHGLVRRRDIAATARKQNQAPSAV